MPGGRVKERKDKTKLTANPQLAKYGYDQWSDLVMRWDMVMGWLGYGAWLWPNFSHSGRLNYEVVYC